MQKQKKIPLKSKKKELPGKKPAAKIVKKVKAKILPAKPIFNPEAFPVLNMAGEEVSQVKLDKQVFDGRVNSALLYQVVNMYRANQRRGTASTKTRGEVSGGGIKPWRQKGTGRARVGSIRSPLWRHGGITFGPHPRDYSYALSQAIRGAALKSSLNAKLKNADLLLMQELKLNSHKTKDLRKILDKLNIKDKALILLKDLDTNLIRASRNIPYIDVEQARNANAYEVLRHKKLIFTKDALQQITQRLIKC